MFEVLCGRLKANMQVFQVLKRTWRYLHTSDARPECCCPKHKCMKTNLLAVVATAEI